MIDLRTEFKNWIETECGGVGMWVVLRSFDITKHSQFWIPSTHEAVGGPAYEYTDTLAEVYMIAAGRVLSNQDTTVSEKVGAFLDKRSVFYFKDNYVMKEYDEIYTLDYYKHTQPLVVYNKSEENVATNKINIKKKYRISKVENHRGDEGRVEFISATAEEIVM